MLLWLVFVPWFNSNKTETTRCITSKFNPGRNLTYQTMAIFFAAGWPTHLFQHFNILGPKPRRFPFWWSPIGGIFWCFCLRLIGWPKVRLFGDQMTKVTDLVLDNHPKKHIETNSCVLFVPGKAFEKATWLGIYSWSRGCETHRWRPSVSSKAMRSALSNGAPIEEGGDLTHPTVTRLEDGELRVWVEINYCYFSAPFGSQHQWLRTWPSEIWRANLQGNWRGAADGKLRILHLGESWESVCVWKG